MNRNTHTHTYTMYNTREGGQLTEPRSKPGPSLLQQTRFFNVPFPFFCRKIIILFFLLFPEHLSWSITDGFGCGHCIEHSVSNGLCTASKGRCCRATAC